MQNQDDRDYYQRRANEERRAAKGPVVSARAVHSELAQRYAALAAQPLAASEENPSEA